ncbi:546_t:CDS:2 [Rhizophagus irregularis]|nr:546_t:CDS:2 [Rhizophagus irregularis]
MARPTEERDQDATVYIGNLDECFWQDPMVKGKRHEVLQNGYWQPKRRKSKSLFADVRSPTVPPPMIGVRAQIRY